MDATTRASYTERLGRMKIRRDALNVALTAAYKNVEIQTYSLTDSEGGQSATRRDTATLEDQLEKLERNISFYERLLSDRPATFNPRRW